MAETSGRFGDVIVLFLPEEERVELLATKGLGDPIRQCVARAMATKSCLLRPPRDAAGYSWDRVRELHFGQPRPLFPPIETLMGPWQRYLGASWFWTRSRAESALRRLLPPDVSITPERCLWHPSSATLLAASKLWFARTGHEVAQLWTGQLDATFGGGARRDTWLLVGEDQLVSVTRRAMISPDRPLRPVEWLDYRAGGGGTEVCLHNLDAAARAQIRSSIDNVGKGWRGSLSDILSGPRVSLPSDRRYIDVALPLTGICGVDRGGALVCSGQRHLGDGLTSPVAQVVASAGRVCVRTVNGVVACRSPKGQAERVPSGPFSSISLGDDHACAIKLDRTVNCWTTTTGDPEVTPPGTFRELASGGGRCAIRGDQRAVCWDATGGQVREYEGTFVHVDGSGSAGCAVAEGGRASCWSHWSDASPLLEGERFREIVAPKHDYWCGITERDEMRCGGREYSGPAVAGRGRYRRLTSNAVQTCALDEQGQVACWGESWPWLGGARRFQKPGADTER